MNNAFSFNAYGSVSIVHADDIVTAIAAAIDEAAAREETGQGQKFRFTFNSITVAARADSKPELLLRDWMRVNNGLLPQGTVVGPYPPETVSEETQRLEQAVMDARHKLREAREALIQHHFAIAKRP